MSRIILGILIGLTLGVVGAILLGPSLANSGLRKARDTNPQSAIHSPQSEGSFVQRGSNGQTVIKLGPKEQARIGLKVASLQAAEAPSEVKGFGRVLDPAPLAVLVAEEASAQVALQASTKEYERVKSLFAQNQNASARALETAATAMNKDRVTLESVQWRLLAGWGKEIASRPDLPAFVASLAARQAVLIRLEVPLGEQPKVPPVGARVAWVDRPETMIQAQVLGPAPATDPQLQTEGYLFLAKAESLAPGTALVAWLTVPGPARSGVIIPREAVLRHQGETFIYLQSDDTFQRKAVTLERPVDNGWFVAVGVTQAPGSQTRCAALGVASPLQPQDKVVTVGAQQLLSEELKSQAGGEE